METETFLRRWLINIGKSDFFAFKSLILCSNDSVKEIFPSIPKFVMSMMSSII